MKSSTENAETIKALVENARDSLQHALDHFFELNQGSARKWHHQKWIILSTHHSASCLVCAWLKEADPNNKCFKNKDGGVSFPHLDDSIKELIKFENTKHLTHAEAALLNMFKRLNSIRNEIMHRTPPTEFNKAVIAFAAMSIVGMLHTVSRRCGLSFEELFNEYPENRKPIIEAIHYSRVEDYCKFIERVLEDQYPIHLRSFCPTCVTRSVIGHHCEACFEEVTEATCDACGEEVNILSNVPFDQSCTECGSTIRR
jgi:hypothetical protein